MFVFKNSKRSFNMQSSETARLTVDGKSFDFPVNVATTGEKAIDISKLRAQTGYVTLDDGLANTAACESAITYIDGEKGILHSHQTSIVVHPAEPWWR